ncbi:MAG: calcium-binding protein, partial [Okeania sp. SIO3B3]|nr:calcium-binding protein [Okeania sp. SIO3B3]
LIGGAGADSILLRSGDGNDQIQGYVDGTDNFLLDGLTFNDLTIGVDPNNSGNTIIQTNISGSTETLGTLVGFNDIVNLTNTDFVIV